MKNQRLKVTKLCARQDWGIASIYEDNGFSGMTNDRPGLKDMLRDAAKGKFSVVVVWDVSRLTRVTSVGMDILCFLEVHGVDFCVASQAMECPHTDESFLLSLKHGEPNWDVLGIPHLQNLQALQWKFQNIRRMWYPRRTHLGIRYSQAIHESFALLKIWSPKFHNSPWWCGVAEAFANDSITPGHMAKMH